MTKKTLQGLGLGKLFPARESLVSDILAGDRKSLNLYLQCNFLEFGRQERDISEGMYFMSHAQCASSFAMSF